MIVIFPGLVPEYAAAGRQESSSICSVTFILSIGQVEQADEICGARLSPPTPLLLLAKVLAEAKLNKTVNLMYTWQHVYSLPYIDISHVVFVGFISSLLCAHAATDSSPRA